MKLPLMIIAMSTFITLAMAQGNEVSYTDGSTKLKGYFVKAKNTKGSAPGVVIVHAWMGLDEHAKNSANKLSELGYNALAADIYGEGVRPSGMQEASKTSGYYRSNPKIYQDRVKAAINELIRQGADVNKIVVMGYCFGGTGALEAARAGMPVLGVVSFHGGLAKDTSRTNGQITPKVLVLHGADDPYVPEADVKKFQKEMRDGKADWQMISYGNAVHSFTDISAGNDNSKGAAYNEKAAKRSWEDMKVFLKEVFGV
jgi:dienelactone hydrolase